MDKLHPLISFAKFQIWLDQGLARIQRQSVIYFVDFLTFKLSLQFQVQADSRQIYPQIVSKLSDQSCTENHLVLWKQRLEQNPTKLITQNTHRKKSDKNIR